MKYLGEVLSSSLAGVPSVVRLRGALCRNTLFMKYDNIHLLYNHNIKIPFYQFTVLLSLYIIVLFNHHNVII